MRSPIWCWHSPQWPNISPRSGKHSLSAACPKKETKTTKTQSKIVFVLGIYDIFCKRLAWTKFQRHWNVQIQEDKGQHRSQNRPRWPFMSPIWCQRGPKCSTMAQNRLNVGPTLALQRPTQPQNVPLKWPNMSHFGANVAQNVPSPKWPKISPIWSQLLPNKGQQLHACWGDFREKSSPTKRRIVDRGVGSL